ncbi:hypothetical protein GCM10007383_38020 [Arenibacter certesii]|uniref:Fibronectin type-III domain-containing protein n=2 Tax=Arenibacter certesii TaxID=228955 RepID=A0A918J7M0_9FLAO|nr:hypothetical protein GCM10007383_38020 [Arenibacter certesii]
MFPSCSTDDTVEPVPIDKEEPTEEEVEERKNVPPDSFNLTALKNGATGVDTNPMLSWEAAVDQNKDAVTYDVYLDNHESPATKIAENLTTLEWVITENLEKEATYFWRVVAKDANNAETESAAIFSFTTRGLLFSETAVVANAAFSKRNHHSLIEFNDKLWLIGGIDDSFNLNEIWSSTDGENWTLVAEDALNLPPIEHTSLVYNNKLWVISGSFNRVWSSGNGIDWVEETSSAAFSNRKGHASVVFDDKMWVIGGHYDGITLNDVWYSTDGITWTEAIESAAFSPRAEHTVHIMNNTLYLMGGASVENFSQRFYNDIYSSTDGIHWTQISTTSVFPVRSSHTAVTFDNKMWVTGGWSAIVNQETTMQDVVSYNDTWFSEDGISWTQLTVDASFTGRLNHTATVFNNKIIITGGMEIISSEMFNDIWTIE